MKPEILNQPILTEKPPQKPVFDALTLFGIFGIGGGVLAIFIGFIFLIVHTALNSDVIFDEIGTGLMISSFPLMILGGHFLDKATPKNK